MKGCEEIHQVHLLGRQHEELGGGWDYGEPSGQTPSTYLIILLEFTRKTYSKINLLTVLR